MPAGVQNFPAAQNGRHTPEGIAENQAPKNAGVPNCDAHVDAFARRVAGWDRDPSNSIGADWPQT